MANTQNTNADPRLVAMLTFVTDPDTSIKEKYKQVREFMLTALDFEPVSPAFEHRTLIRRNNPIPTPPPGTKSYKERLENAKSTLTQDDYSTPLSAIGALLKLQVVIEIEKDIITAELHGRAEQLEATIQELRSTVGLERVSNFQLKQEMTKLETENSTTRNELSACQQQLHQQKTDNAAMTRNCNVHINKLNQEKDELKKRNELLDRLISKARQDIKSLRDQPGIPYPELTQDLTNTKAALTQTSNDLTATQKLLLKRIKELAHLRTEIKSSSLAITTLQEDLAEHRMWVGNLQGVSEYKTRQLNNAYTSIRDLENEIKTLKAEARKRDKLGAAVGECKESTCVKKSIDTSLKVPGDFEISPRSRHNDLLGSPCEAVLAWWGGLMWGVVLSVALVTLLKWLERD